VSDSREPASARARHVASGVVIRPIRRDEVPRVWHMLEGLAEWEKMTDILTGTPAMLEAALFAPGSTLEARVAEENGELLGYALFYPAFGSFRAVWRLWLEDLFVRPEARGRGVGELLLAEMCRIAIERGWFGVDWEVLDWNESALEFYRRQGAVDLGGGWKRYRLSGEAMRALASRRTVSGA